MFLEIIVSVPRYHTSYLSGMHKKQEGRVLLILSAKIRQISVMVILLFTTLLLELGDFLVMRLIPVNVLKMFSGYSSGLTAMNL